MLGNFIIYLICAYGISNIIVYSSGPFELFSNLRELADSLPSNLGEALHCMICFPTWVGMALSAINIWLIPYVDFAPAYSIINDSDLWYLIIPLDGAIASGGVWLIDTVQERIEK